MSSEVETSLIVLRKNSERFLDSARNDKERALEYEQQPPDEAWNAVEVFKKK